MPRNLLFSMACLALIGPVRSQGTICGPQGNVVLFSNYDGGALVINVDQNIPNLFIGVVSYEFTKISITGPFAGNVTQVVYAGYNGNNDHCNMGTTATTSVTGVPANLVSILFAPSVSFPNSNGYGSVICGYSCDVNTNQGGCNTADQVAHYFLFNYGGILRSHTTQYGCWQGVQNLSAGGNCCEDPLATGIASPNAGSTTLLQLDRSGELLTVHTTRSLIVMDATGRTVREIQGNAGGRVELDLSTLPVGGYLVREQFGGAYARFLVAR